MKKLRLNGEERARTGGRGGRGEGANNGSFRWRKNRARVISLIYLSLTLLIDLLHSSFRHVFVSSGLPFQIGSFFPREQDRSNLDFRRENEVGNKTKKKGNGIDAVTRRVTLFKIRN